jgi:hypothetical protein
VFSDTFKNIFFVIFHNCRKNLILQKVIIKGESVCLQITVVKLFRFKMSRINDIMTSIFVTCITYMYGVNLFWIKWYLYLFIYLFSYGLLKHENMQLSLYKAYQKLRNDHWMEIIFYYMNLGHQLLADNLVFYEDFWIVYKCQYIKIEINVNML